MLGADRYGWNDKSARYYDRITGRYVSRDIVRHALDGVLSFAADEARDVSSQLREGTVDLAEWQAKMRQLTKDSMLQAQALARGGWDQLTSSDYGKVGAAVRMQYEYLDKFTKEIRRGLPLDGRFLSRASMYPKSARPFFHDEQRALLDDTGYSEERNVLHPAEHCDECMDQSAAGWVPIGTLIPIGGRTCLGNDQCTMRYR